MLSALGNAALQHIAGAADNVRGPPNFTAQVQQLAKQVNAKMNNYESMHAKQYEPGVCALYLHWFLSIPALMECGIRLACHAFLLLFMALTYYIIYCIMCGKHQVAQNSCFDHQFKMYGLYSGLLCVVPWAPALYAFQQQGLILNRPAFDGVVLEGHSIDVLIKRAVCSCCCHSCIPNYDIPMYKLLQTLLYSYGGIYACGSMSACCGECGINGSFQQYLIRAKEAAVQENANTTATFYRNEYGVSCFEELIQQQIGGGISAPVYVAAPYPPAAVAPIYAASVPAYTSVPQAQVMTAQPGQPVVVRAVQVNR